MPFIRLAAAAVLAGSLLAAPALAQTPPASGSQPGGLGTTGEGGVTAGSLGIGAGPAAVVNPPGTTIRDPLRPSGAAGPLRADPTSETAPTPSASAYGDWSATGGAQPPQGYSGSASDWSRHVAACQARYRTYDAATDMFYARPGVQARCRL